MLVSWQGLGNLNNGSNAGLWYVNGNNGLSNENYLTVQNSANCSGVVLRSPYL